MHRENELIISSEERARFEPMVAQFREIFESRPLVAASAPGRSEVVGGHTDYFHGSVIAGTTKSRCRVVLGFNQIGGLRIFSNQFRQDKPVEIPLVVNDADLEALNNGPESWAARIVSIYRELSLRARAWSEKGTDILIDSEVPLTGGVSSSAAMGVSVLKGLGRLLHREVPTDEEQALLVQKAEHALGANTGLLDQTASLAGGTHLLDFAYGRMRVVEALPLAEMLDKNAATIVVATDTAITRDHRHSAYGARRDMQAWMRPYVAEHLVLFNHVLGDVEELCDLDTTLAASLLDTNFFQNLDGKWRGQFPDQPFPLPSDMIKHILNEARRVQKAAEAIKLADFSVFCDQVNVSGVSAVAHYALHQPNVPQLLTAVNLSQRQPGMYATRPMGGGSNVTMFMVVRETDFLRTGNLLNEKYGYFHPGHQLTFLPIGVGEKAGVFEL